MTRDSLLRLYLLAGLVIHKVLWEVLKRQQRSARPVQAAPSLRQRLIKGVKVAILLGLAVQTLIPPVFPIAADPHVLQLVGVLLYSIGLGTAMVGRLQLDTNWSDIEACVVPSGQLLVSRGIYRYIRHPIYGGDLVLLFGLELCLNSWLVLGVALLVPIVVRQVLREEELLLESLRGYASYYRATKRFIPFLV